jgi:hypothetical protein
MAIDKETKKKVTEDWLSVFPQLSEFSQNKLFKVVGSCIIGIELIKLPHSDDYRPHFVLYPLWKSDLKNCLDSPTISFAIRNKKGLQFSIPYLKHGSYFTEAADCLKKQVAVSLNDNVTLKSLFDLVENHSNDILIKSNSAQQAKLFELKFYAALYVGSQSQVQKVLNQITQSSKSWNMNMFENWHGKFDLWYRVLEELVDSREDFLKKIETNSKDKKIAQLKSAKLTE